jgi:hypothetical protein
MLTISSVQIIDLTYRKLRRSTKMLEERYKHSEVTWHDQSIYLLSKSRVQSKYFFFLIFIVLLFICAYNSWVISPPCPHPLPYHPHHPLPLLPPPRYPAETILPLSLILLKREYKQ